MRVGPLRNRIEQPPAHSRVKPARMTHQPSVVCHRGLLFTPHNAGKIIGLRERKLGVAEGGHGRESSSFRSRERPGTFIPGKQQFKMIEVHRHRVGLIGILNQNQPLHDVSLDGMRQIVHRVGTIRQSKVDDRCRTRVVARIAPQKIRRMQIVVRPQRSEFREQRRQLRVKGSQQFQRFICAGARVCTAGE